MPCTYQGSIVKQPTLSFPQFLEYFPEVPLPVNLTDESARDFSRYNDPLPQPLIDRFIRPFETEWDELSEVVPCLRIPDTFGFYALVYWRAHLMHYQYVLATFTKEGEPIGRQLIAGTISDGNTLVNSMAVIEDDWEILILSGKSDARGTAQYEAQSSAATKLELLPDGRIVSLQ